MFKVLDGFAKSNTDAILLVARFLIAFIFMPGGFEKLTSLDHFSASLAAHGIPVGGSFALAVLGACVELLGSAAILLGLAFRPTALLMALFTLIAALISHRFWEYPDASRAMQEINFNKNLAIIGGFLGLFVVGPGAYSLDRRIGLASPESLRRPA
jgi:putative oxidoreductase